MTGNPRLIQPNGNPCESDQSEPNAVRVRASFSRDRCSLETFFGQNKPEWDDLHCRCDRLGQKIGPDVSFYFRQVVQLSVETVSNGHNVRWRCTSEWWRQLPVELVFGVSGAADSRVHRYDEQTTMLQSTATDMYRTAHKRLLTRGQSNSARTEWNQCRTDRRWPKSDHMTLEQWSHRMRLHLGLYARFGDSTHLP